MTAEKPPAVRRVWGGLPRSVDTSDLVFTRASALLVRDKERCVDRDCRVLIGESGNPLNDVVISSQESFVDHSALAVDRNATGQVAVRPGQIDPNCRGFRHEVSLRIPAAEPATCRRSPVSGSESHENRTRSCTDSELIAHGPTNLSEAVTSNGFSEEMEAFAHELVETLGAGAQAGGPLEVHRFTLVWEYRWERCR